MAELEASFQCLTYHYVRRFKDTLIINTNVQTIITFSDVRGTYYLLVPGMI